MCERVSHGWDDASARESDRPRHVTLKRQVLPSSRFACMLMAGQRGEPMTTTAPDSLDFQKPPLSEVDVYGCTHKGHVRKTNADHFLIASFHRAMRVHASSLPSESGTMLSPDTRGFVAMVADGVGGLAHGEEGSAQATDAAARYLLEM